MMTAYSVDIARLQERLRVAYEERERAAWALREKGMKWHDIGRELGCSRVMAMRCAARWARRQEQED